MKTTYALLAGLAAQQAAATWSLSAKPFTSPQYADNECSDKQKGGFDWSDLKDGDSNFQYGDFDFSKDWKCSNSFGKRDVLTKRTFGNKAITNKCTKDKPASFGCNKRKDGFSITTIDVSVEFDVEIDLHYTMTDGSLCKQKSVPCKKDGSTIENTQCGGAKSVDVYLGSRYKGGKSECQIGFHHIGFDCDKPKPFNPPPPPQVSSTPPATSKAATTPPSVQSSAARPVSSSSPLAQTPPVQTRSFSSLPPFANSSIAAPPTYQTPKVTPPSLESSTVTPLPASSTALSSPPSQESSAPPSSASTLVPGTSSAPPSQSSSVAYPPSSYPPKEVGDVLPTCMNTWLQISTEDCKDNTATDCYCKNAKFTKNVIDCVQAWCKTDEETKATLQYLVGICAQHVPENPGLVSDCPKDTFDNTPATPPSGVQSPGAPAPTTAPSTPVTTIVYGSTSLTVPQVHFTTEVPAAGSTPTAPVGLVPGVAPPQTPATTTAALAPYPVPSTLKATVQPTGTGAVRPSSPAQFTGAATPFKAEAKHVMLGAALAFLAL